MSKIGVGVGEDFPVDDSKQQEQGRDWDREFADRRDAHQRWHDQRREWKRQWKEEWYAQRGGFHAVYAGHRGVGPRLSWNAIFAVLAVLGVIAIVGFVFSHIYVLIGILVVTALLFAYRRGFHPFEFLRSHDFSARAEKRPEAPSQDNQ